MTTPEGNAPRSVDFQALRLVSRDGASAAITPYGAHLVSWMPAPDFGERLFLSSQSEYRPGAAIRGGVPVIFPQFAAEGPLPKHGFARTSVWTRHASGEQGSGAAWAQFALQDSAATRALWAHSFEGLLTVCVGGAELDIRLRIRNTGTAPFSFTSALHSYLRVADIGKVAVRGLQGLHFRDTAEGGRLRLEQMPSLRLEGEVDRIYLGAPGLLEVEDGPRRMTVSAPGFADCVIWNPGAAKAAALSDLEPGGFRRFVCVEAAAVGVPVSLVPGATWEGAQLLRAT